MSSYEWQFGKACFEARQIERKITKKEEEKRREIEQTTKIINIRYDREISVLKSERERWDQMASRFQKIMERKHESVGIDYFSPKKGDMPEFLPATPQPDKKRKLDEFNTVKLTPQPVKKLMFDESASVKLVPQGQGSASAKPHYTFEEMRAFLENDEAGESGKNTETPPKKKPEKNKSGGRGGKAKSSDKVGTNSSRDTVVSNPSSDKAVSNSREMCVGEDSGGDRDGGGNCGQVGSSMGECHGEQRDVSMVGQDSGSADSCNGGDRNLTETQIDGHEGSAECKRSDAGDVCQDSSGHTGLNNQDAVEWDNDISDSELSHVCMAATNMVDGSAEQSEKGMCKTAQTMKKKSRKKGRALQQKTKEKDDSAEQSEKGMCKTAQTMKKKSQKKGRALQQKTKEKAGNKKQSDRPQRSKRAPSKFFLMSPD